MTRDHDTYITFWKSQLLLPWCTQDQILSPTKFSSSYVDYFRLCDRNRTQLWNLPVSDRFLVRCCTSWSRKDECATYAGMLFLSLQSTSVFLHRTLQVDDLMGMQACNLQNLPENYTMKYCAYASYSEVVTKQNRCRQICIMQWHGHPFPMWQKTIRGELSDISLPKCEHQPLQIRLRRYIYIWNTGKRMSRRVECPMVM